MMQYRRLGGSEIKVTALGMGCWAIGGPFWFGDYPVGWGKVDDNESIHAIKKSIDMGVNFFETADVYGTGHSEEIIGQAIKGYRDKVVIATKFGMIFEAGTGQINAIPANLSPSYVRKSCEASLKRLNTDYIDCYMLHVGEYDENNIPAIINVLDDLVAEGKIRSYGWCNHNDPKKYLKMAEGTSFHVIERPFNVLHDQPEAISLCEQNGWAFIANSPLGMGLLSGKFTTETKLPEDDVRKDWDFKHGEKALQLKKLEAIREILTQNGRTLTQGALAWLWARHENIIPIPGFRTVRQVEENAKAMEYGPLTATQMEQISTILQ